MAYRVKIESFEGPFDLLLYLVSKQKVDVGTISITEIADQYLNEIQNMKKLDLDVASDFLLTAATLLKIKAESLIPCEVSEVDEEVSELAPSDAREMLIEKLITYKMYKSAGASLLGRARAEARMHSRCVGMNDEFGYVAPDYLANTSLEVLASLAAGALSRREIELLESEHIAKKPIPVEVYMDRVMARLDELGARAARDGAQKLSAGDASAPQAKATFYELLDGNTEPPVVVVTFLAILELHKSGRVAIRQERAFGNIDVEYIESVSD